MNEKNTKNSNDMFSISERISFREGNKDSINNTIKRLQGFWELSGKCCNSFRIIYLGGLGNIQKENYCYSVYLPIGISPTILSTLGGGKQPYILINEND